MVLTLPSFRRKLPHPRHWLKLAELVGSPAHRIKSIRQLKRTRSGPNESANRSGALPKTMPTPNVAERKLRSDVRLVPSLPQGGWRKGNRAYPNPPGCVGLPRNRPGQGTYRPRWCARRVWQGVAGRCPLHQAGAQPRRPRHTSACCWWAQRGGARYPVYRQSATISGVKRGSNFRITERASETLSSNEPGCPR